MFSVEDKSKEEVFISISDVLKEHTPTCRTQVIQLRMDRVSYNCNLIPNKKPKGLISWYFQWCWVSIVCRSSVPHFQGMTYIFENILYYRKYKMNYTYETLYELRQELKNMRKIKGKIL